MFWGKHFLTYLINLLIQTHLIFLSTGDRTKIKGIFVAFLQPHPCPSVLQFSLSRPRDQLMLQQHSWPNRNTTQKQTCTVVSIYSCLQEVSAFKSPSLAGQKTEPGVKIFQSSLSWAENSLSRDSYLSFPIISLV